MKTENVTTDKKYGKVLFDIAKEENKVEEVYEELIALREIYEDVPELGKILSDDRLEPFEKIDILSELEAPFGSVLNKFMRVVYEYGRMDEIPTMIDEYEFMYYENQEVLLVTVTTCLPLSTEQEEQLKAKIAEVFDYKKVMLKKRIDTQIIGGIIISANNKVIDKSVKKQLSDMHKELMN